MSGSPARVAAIRAAYAVATHAEGLAGDAARMAKAARICAHATQNGEAFAPGFIKSHRADVVICYVDLADCLAALSAALEALRAEVES